MNYKQCEDFLELHKYNEALDEAQFESLRQRMYMSIGQLEMAQEEGQQASEPKAACGQEDRLILCLEPLSFPVETVVYLERALKLAGYKVMTYCPQALGDYRNRWKIRGKALSQKNLCQIIEQLQDAVKEPGAQELKTQEAEIPVPSRTQMEQLVAEMAFAQSNVKVLLWYASFRMVPKVDGVDRYEVPVPSLKSYKVTKKSLKKQVMDYDKEKGISLEALGKEALIGACQTLETLTFFNEKGLTVETKHAKLAFEETSARNHFGVISYKPLFVLDDAQNACAGQRLAEDMESYLSGKQVVLLLGATKKTDVDGLFKALCLKASFILTVAPPRMDRIPSYELAQEALKYHPGVSAVDSIEEAMEIIGMVLPKDGVVLTVGCQELLSQVMAIVNKDIF